MDTPRKETPLLFNAPMVRAILEGRKTQTRRVVKQQPPAIDGAYWEVIVCGDCVQFLATDEVDPDFENPLHQSTVRNPHGQPGDLIWVKEPWRIGEDVGEGWYPGAFTGDLHLIYDSDGYRDYRSFPADYRWPRNAKETHNSEGTDEHWISYGPIPSIFMPRWASRLLLEVISVRVERLQDISEADCIAEGAEGGHGAIPGYNYSATPCEHYRHIWESINGPGSWDANPWVWAINFKPIGGAQ